MPGAVGAGGVEVNRCERTLPRWLEVKMSSAGDLHRWIQIRNLMRLSPVSRSNQQDLAQLMFS